MKNCRDCSDFYCAKHGVGFVDAAIYIVAICSICPLLALLAIAL